jgi:hypothetical protein
VVIQIVSNDPPQDRLAELARTRGSARAHGARLDDSCVI